MGSSPAIERESRRAFERARTTRWSTHDSATETDVE